MTFIWAFFFVLAVLVFWSMNLFGLPGNWMIVATTVLYAWLSPVNGSGGLRWPAVALVTGLALLGELVELGASAASVKKVGGGRLGAVLALFGSIVGAMTGVVVGLPIPLIGSAIAALLFAGLGALVGAMLGETMAGRSLTDSWKIGHAAFWGRLFGTTAKILIGAVVAGVAIAVVFV
jgi:uncharacterized protein YqgC (DUF456 family)